MQPSPQTAALAIPLPHCMISLAFRLVYSSLMLAATARPISALFEASFTEPFRQDEALRNYLPRLFRNSALFLRSAG